MSIFTGQCVSILNKLSPRTQPRQCESPTLANRPEAMNQGIKSELKFSIENILGLSSASQSRVPDVSSNTQEYGNDDENDEQANDDEDDDEDDDDEDDEESIDVDDSQVEDNVNTRCFVGDKTQASGGEDSIQYPWLQCTRYHPPKLQRSKKKEGHKKWKLGRNPRIPFTQHQLVVLEDKFRRTHYLSSMDVAELSSALSLTETRVKIWFQNRRARERRDKGGAQNQHPVVQKPFQPLTIPTVSWSVPVTSNYVHYQQTLDFRSRYLVSSLGMYNTPDGNKVISNEDCRDKMSM